MNSRRAFENRRGPRAAGIVLAGGSGSRVGAAINKAFLPLAGRSLASWGLNTMAAIPQISPLVFVVRPEDTARAEHVVQREVFGQEVELIHGGDTRQESELHALRHLADRIDSGDVSTVLIHDAARPLASHGLMAAVLHAAHEYGGAVPGLPAPDVAQIDDLGKMVRGGGAQGVGQNESLLGMLRVQTPQGFDAGTLLDAYEAAARDGFAGTDTASCAEKYTDIPVQWVVGEETNFKVTYAQDLLLAQDVVAALGLTSNR